MNLTSLITDNITEILVRIIEFTQARQKILTQNIINVHNLNFIPKELEVKEFSALLSNAVAEYIKNERLLLQDTDNIKFGTGCSFQAKPIIDEHSMELFKSNKDEYLDLQIKKILENSLNQRVAAELIKHRQENIESGY